MKKIIVCMIMSFLYSQVFAQASDSLLVYGVKKVKHSSILGEERKYFVALPDGYATSDESYPVIYLLDAEINFQMVVGMNQFLTRGRIPMMSKAIVVGICNTDRTRDLTPTKAKDAADLKNQKGGSYKNSGGADKFIDFIIKELRPEINKTYRTNHYTLFAGHSFGGLTVINAYFTRPNDFNAFLAIDPSLWWDDSKLLTALERKQVSFSKSNALYVAFSGSREDNAQRNTLQHEIKAAQLKEIKVKMDFFEDENHGTVALPAFFNGMKFLLGDKKSVIR